MNDYSGIRTQATRLALFETPVAQCALQDADVMLEDIRRVVLDKMAGDPGVERSNVGGWHSDVDMLVWGGAGAKKLADTAIGVAKRMTAFHSYTHDDYLWVCQMWANVSDQNASNHLHIHPGNLWSGALYVDMGGAEEDPGLGGEFYFEDPRFPLTVMHNTQFRFAGADGHPAPISPTFRPKRGEILMFPAWLRHGVRPYKGDKQRISIAFNVDAVPK